jgi:glycosyltransferase involved in cell wall biosynthesis
MKLNWFSPLPPAKTGIARYTADLLPALCRRADITLWTDQDECDQRLHELAPVRRYDPQQPSWHEINDADLSIYHIGNHHGFHFAPWQMNLHQPGLVVLHDLRLHDFFAGVFRARWHNRDGYLAYLESQHGPIARRDGEAFWSGKIDGREMATRYPLTAAATERSLAVLVHTPEARDALRANHQPVIYAALPFAATPRATGQREQRNPAVVRLIVFGYLGPNRRLDVLLQVLANMREKDRFRLEVCGELWNDDALHDQVRLLRLEHIVTCRGFVSDAELTAALDRADLAINLRNPSMGEASLSQLQIWDHALPSLVSQVGWYATLPRETVAFVRPDQEVADIAHHLRAFLSDRRKFIEMGRRGRAFLEDVHSSEAYVDTLLKLGQTAAIARRRQLALHLADRVGAELGHWSSGQSLDQLLAGPASQIKQLFSADSKNALSRQL